MVDPRVPSLVAILALLTACEGAIGDGNDPGHAHSSPSPSTGAGDGMLPTGSATSGASTSSGGPSKPEKPKTVFDDAPDNAWIDTGLTYQGGNEVPAVFDQQNQLFFKYGGCGDGTPPVNISFPQGDPKYPNGYSNTLWVVDVPSQTWQLRRPYDASWPNDRPGNGCSRSYVYDANRKVVWMYGGVSDGGGGGYVWDLWSYDGAADTFARLNSQNLPPSAINDADGSIIVHDPVNDVIVMPRGETTWVLHFDTNTWEARPTPNGPPSPGHYTSMIFEPTLGRVLMPKAVPTGQSAASLEPGMDPDHWRPSATGYLEFEFQTWTYDAATNVWEMLHPQQSPEPSYRMRQGLTYDSKNQVAIMVGGSSSTWDELEQYYNDIWVYHADQNTWLKRNPPGQLPSSDRDARQLAYGELENAVFYLPRTGHVWVYRYQ